ncbi:MAG: FAD-dependent oxidoreductase, partial [Planctomycetota bacterium]
ELSTLDALKRAGLSDRVIDRFFRPFFGGVFFDPDLITSARMLAFTYRNFATGQTVLPTRGMRAIPEQIASHLPTERMQLRAPVASIDVDNYSVSLQSGDVITASAIVVATDWSASARLLGEDVVGTPRWQRTTTLAYDALEPPKLPKRSEPTLVLDGTGDGPINHLAVVSNAQPAYAPAGRSLVLANAVGAHAERDDLDAASRAQLRDWFGDAVQRWNLIKTDRIDLALPSQPPEHLSDWKRPVRTPREGVYVCGDFIDNASINGAMVSGWRAAEALLAATT